MLTAFVWVPLMVWADKGWAEIMAAAARIMAVE